MVALSGTVRNPRTGKSVAWVLCQPGVDMVSQFAKYFPKARNGGTIGNAVTHLPGFGDHTPWAGDVIGGKRHKAGVVYADDLMSHVTFDPTEFVFEFLRPRVLAGYYDELKYLLTDWKLIDRRYTWRFQKGGDGPDHVHVSFMPGYESVRSNVIRDYYYWKRNGKPKVGQKPAAPAPPKVVVSAERKYTRARRGEGLAQIAARTKTSWKTLASLNGIKGPKYIVSNGQKIWLEPAKPVPRPFTTVRAGEGLINVSRRTGVPWRTLAKINGVKGPQYRLSKGQKLYLK